MIVALTINLQFLRICQAGRTVKTLYYRSSRKKSLSALSSSVDPYITLTEANQWENKHIREKRGVPTIWSILNSTEYVIKY